MPLSPQPTAEVREITRLLLQELRNTLGDRLFALYLFGSATTSAYQPGVSDLDTVAVLADEPSDNDVLALASMHARLTASSPAWDDRIEVDYLSAQSLREFRSHPWPAARICPGEPFHRIHIDRRWVLDWYQVLTGGFTLYGPPASDLIPPISQAEFVDAVRGQLSEWPDRISRATQPGQLAYAVLTLCRALRACMTGEHVSKKEAAAWTSEKLPQFRAVIDAAVGWRYGRSEDLLSLLDRNAANELSQAVIRLCSEPKDASRS